MSATITKSDTDLQKIDPKKIVQREGHNPRGDVDTKSDAFKELVASIEEHGVLQPILVGPATIESGKEKLYPVIAGHRRHAAALQLKLAEIPAMVADLNGGGFSAAVAENLIREDMSPLQEARAIETLRTAGKMKQADAAKALGKSERWARNRARLLDMPEPVQDALEAGELPLEAVAHLAPIVKVRPAAATKVVEHVKAGKATNAGKRIVLAELADRDLLLSTFDGIAASLGFQQVSDADYSRQVTLANLAIEGGYRKEVKELYEALPKLQYGNRPGFTFAKDAFEKAKKCSALLTVEVERWGHKEQIHYITKPELTFDLCIQQIPKIKKDVESRHGGPAPMDTPQAAEDRKKQAEREEKKRKKTAEQAEATNKALGDKLAALTNPKATDVEIVRLVCAMALGSEDYMGDLVEDGLGKIAPEKYAYSEGLVDGSGERLPEQTVEEELASAKTAAECLKIILRVAIANKHVVGGGVASWGFPGPKGGDPLDVTLMIDDIAERLKVLPKPALETVKVRRKEGQERAERKAKQLADEAKALEKVSGQADKALELLKAEPGLTAEALAKKLEVKPNLLYRLLADLIDEGKVTKKGREYSAVAQEASA